MPGLKIFDNSLTKLKKYRLKYSLLFLLYFCLINKNRKQITVMQIVEMSIFTTSNFFITELRNFTLKKNNFFKD